MKLNKKGRDELRERVNMKLNDVEFNPESRIKLPLDVLEEILFDYKKNGNYKVIGFVSDNICKLDLSEVSFYNVSFNSDKHINLSNTNGNYDFSKTFEYLDHGKAIIRNTSFENVDLSNHSLEGEVYFANCNLRNTNLFPFWIDCETTLSSCDVRDNDLSMNGAFKPLTAREDEDICGDLFFTQSGCNTYFINCNLAGSNVHINLDDDLSESSYDYLNHIIEMGYLDGCYLNDKVILTKEEKRSNRNELLRQYNKFKTDRVNETIELIDKQLSHFGGRQKNLKKNLNQDSKNNKALDYDGTGVAGY